MIRACACCTDAWGLEGHEYELWEALAVCVGLSLSGWLGFNRWSFSLTSPLPASFMVHVGRPRTASALPWVHTSYHAGLKSVPAPLGATPGATCNEENLEQEHVERTRSAAMRTKG